MRVEHGQEIIVCIPTAFLLVRYLMSNFALLQWNGKVRLFKGTVSIFMVFNNVY